MDWYAAKLVFQIITDQENTSQFDEQIRLVNAISQQLALEMAHQIGHMAQEELETKNGSLLKWKFVAVSEINLIGEIEHGKEIHYHIEEPENADAYVQLITEKALNLKRITAQQLVEI